MMTHFGPLKGTGSSNFELLKNQDGGRTAILKKRKRPYLRNAFTDLHKIWHDDAFWPYEGYGQLKFPTFENPRWRTAAILRNCKWLYLRNGPTDLHKIRHGEAF